MKAVLDLLPIGIGVLLVGALTWFLLDRDNALGPWLLAGLLFAHGWVHIMFVFPTPEATPATAGGLGYPFDMGRSWLISGAGLDAGLVRILGSMVILVTFTVSVLAALATIGFLVPAGWWAGLVLAAAGFSSVMLVLFFSPALLLGFAINLSLMWLALSPFWSPAGGSGTPL